MRPTIIMATEVIIPVLSIVERLISHTSENVEGPAEKDKPVTVLTRKYN